MSVARVREVARRCQRRGLRVVFASGWDRRGNGMSPAYRGDIVHHTATSYANANLSVLIHGRSDLPGPLCNFATWSNGTIGVIAAFPANHAGASGGYNTRPLPISRAFNKYVLGNEIIYPGNQPMTAAQRKSAATLSAVINEVFGYRDADHTRAHAETSITGKWDPGYAPGRTINMSRFRADVRAAMGGRGSADAPTPKKPRSSLLLLEDAMMEFKPAERGTLPLGIPERGLSLQIQVAGAANTPASRLEIHRIQFLRADGHKRTVELAGNRVVQAGDPWAGNWLNAKGGEVTVLIEYSYTGPGAEVHTATASLRRDY